MPCRSFSAQIRRSACFRRVTGVSVTTFDRMLAQLRIPWKAAELRKAKSGRPCEVAGWTTIIAGLVNIVAGLSRI
jgi:hypothetical protein